MKRTYLRGVCILYLILMCLGSVTVVLVQPVNLFETDMQNVLASFSGQNILGTDSLGRDLFYRCLYGVYISMVTGIFGVAMAFLIGLIWGGVAGYFGGWLDKVMTRSTEILMALPSLVVMAILYLILEAVFTLKDRPLLLLVLVLGLSSWMSIARFVRNLILKEKVELYTEAALAIGASRSRIFIKHIFPNIFSSLIVFISLQIPQALVAEGLLSFLGFGVQAPQISLGSLLQDGWKTMSTFPNLLIAPGLFLFLTVFSIYYLLDEFRYNMDPKLRWEKFN